MTDIPYVDLINQVYYSIETLREDPGFQGIHPGCDCGCGGDTFDFDAYTEAAAEALEALAFSGINVVDYD